MTCTCKLLLKLGYPRKAIKFKCMLKPKNGKIQLCAYCGEQVGATAKYCPNCTTQKGRKKIFDENMQIIKDRQANNLSVPETLKSWK